MVIGVLKEIENDERRVALTPDSLKKLIKIGGSARVQKNGGTASHFLDEHYVSAGASIVEDESDIYSTSDVIVKIQPPTVSEVERMKPGTVLVAALKPFENEELIDLLAKKKITTYALELVPRITRAQSMDILSSQANLAGYKAVLMAADTYTGLFPMLMTAAGTVRAAKVLVLGAGVAGLQAIATAKRLGAIVSAFDIRASVKEQVQSLGAKFVDIDLGIEDGEGSGGYARELTEDERKRQIELLGAVIEKQDIVITTAAIPGRPSPKLIAENTVQNMKSGSVIVDLAAEGGGNCELTKPGEEVNEYGVSILGKLNIPSLLATEASNLFARNVVSFLENLADEEGNLKHDLEDEIVAGSMITHQGEIVHPLFSKTQAAQGNG